MDLQADFTACAPGKAHNWIIETPNGVLSHAYCKHCRQERQFPNAGDDALRQRAALGTYQRPKEAKL
jgi:hypothetical protein